LGLEAHERLDLSIDAERGPAVAESVYKVIELVGTSTQSWEKATAAAVKRAAGSLRDLRIAEVIQMDAQIGENGEIEIYRTKIRVSFKYEA
jgi:flavin-binding protein dodecin